jgi:hypothetical protein
MAALRKPLHPAEIEAMNDSLCGHHLPISIPSLLPDSSMASLAGKALTVCSQLPRIGR